MSLKFELIKNVSLTNNNYTIPKNFSANDYFKDCWGIWTSEKEAVFVELLFTPDAVERVLQTEWHGSEKTNRLPDGRLQWTAKIKEPREMLPWIKGWGSMVEVIQPSELREEIFEDIKQQIKNYEKN